MAEHELISADSHVNEPGDLWIERVDKQFRDRAPRVVENPPGQKPGAYLILEGIEREREALRGRLRGRSNTLTRTPENRHDD